ncbi:pyridoxal-phosphate dependent enzyme [Streptomyces sp. 549]|uniref:pyridoxal-phosphate dependent enzyme n=1 Tax=Streptomyces sp. 549 TaxID=3049076 RepID=UPI0024C3DEFC|nr:pyridoxal-phosphate dependent enzyme [Streptomyces sp. 549]MDK1474496.1 pyridoxal-phosphate dependent enzyme [Streptomyces sp. 549]
MRYDSITEAIGNTPLVRIDPAVHGLRHIDLYAKLEMLNPFGSVKDRPAWHMARPHLERAGAGDGTVVELSSGNTAKALALLAGLHGLKFKSVTNRMRVPEIKELLLLLGAEIEELPGRSECLDPTDTDDPLTLFHQALSEPGSTYLHTDQYFNPRNAEAHAAGTGPEIVKDLDGRAPDWFVACVGTAGSSTGVAKVLREHDPDVRVLGLVAHKSDFIPGIRTIDEVHQVGLFDPATYDSIDSVTSQEAIDGMVTLIRRCGLLTGPTGGAAYQGAVRRLAAVDAELAGTGRRQSAVFIVCDRAESYLSYVRERRPELLGRRRRGQDVSALTDAEARAEGEAVDPGEARRWMAQADPRPLVVDLRSPHAYAALHIEGSVNIVDEVFEELARGGLPFSKSTPVLLACPVGEKSLRYAALLTRMGHPEVRSLAGGIVAWRDAGAPLVRE